VRDFLLLQQFADIEERSGKAPRTLLGPVITDSGSEWKRRRRSPRKKRSLPREVEAYVVVIFMLPRLCLKGSMRYFL